MNLVHMCLCLCICDFRGVFKGGKGGPAEGRKLDELSVRVYVHIAGPSNTEHCLSVQHLTIYLIFKSFTFSCIYEVCPLLIVQG